MILHPGLSFFWAVGMNHFMEIAKDEGSTDALGENCKQFNPEKPKINGAPDTQPDFRLEPYRAGSVQ